MWTGHVGLPAPSSRRPARSLRPHQAAVILKGALQRRRDARSFPFRRRSFFARGSPAAFSGSPYCRSSTWSPLSLASTKQKAEENRPWQYKRIDEVVATAGQKLIGLGGIWHGAWHLTTDHGYYRVKLPIGKRSCCSAIETKSSPACLPPRLGNSQGRCLLGKSLRLSVCGADVFT
jgi:hypothetical protein